MSVDRPTFSESWYRVAELKPSLRSTVQVHRQHFRGQMWHVLQDPTSNQFFRLNDPAYTFVAMLDGRRTVAEVWRICNEKLGDEAPTQGEAIQLLGQLYTSNLLQAELPPDAEGLLGRFRKRRIREIQGYLTNLLFIRIPVLDPDRFLDRWLGIFGWLFSGYGLVLWLVMVGIGLYFIAGRGKDLYGGAYVMFHPDKLVWLYVAMVISKVFHEFGHAFSCKRFGTLTGSGGEVHVMGVMFLVFMPLPYVDASSAWAFRSKWHRMIVGAAGMLVELAVASVAAVIWANTAKDTPVSAVCYNIMFMASVSTLLFNGNPLLRYDAYYMLSDLLEIPNLAQRSHQYIYYLVRRYAWSVKRAICPAHSLGERIWFILYGVASTVYRIFIFSAILLFLTDRLPRALAIIAVAFGLASAFAWVCVPAFKFVRYLATNQELVRTRGRAVVSSLVVIAAIVVGVGVVSVPNRERVEGVIAPVDMGFVYAEADGFVEGYLPSCRAVTPGGEPLVRCESRELKAQYAELIARRKKVVVQRSIAMTKEPAAAKVLADQIAAWDGQIADLERQIKSLDIRPPMAGVWVSPDIEHSGGAFVRRGDKLGVVADLSRLEVRAVVPQNVAAILMSRAYRPVEARFKGRPELKFTGQVKQIMPAGQEDLPSLALGFKAGGSIQTAPEDPKGAKASERFFQVLITPDPDAHLRRLIGQRVIIRMTMPDEPLVVQWWRSLSQLVQRKFHV